MKFSIKSLITTILLSVVFLACSAEHQLSNRQILNDSPGTQLGIYRGENISAKHKRHTVGLLNTVHNTLCTGVIIDYDLILTAAHCVVGKNNLFAIYFGDKINHQGEDAEAYSLYVASHEGFFEVYNSEHDIALLKISTILYSNIPEGYEPVQMLADSSILKKGVEVDIVGYGISNLFFDEESGIASQTKLKIVEPNHSPTSFKVARGLRGTCPGDSGGPAFVTVGGKTYLAGILSKSTILPNLNCGFSSTYTRVDIHLDWIKEKAALLRAKEAN